MIAIVSYGMGNIQSVANAIDYLGHDALVATTPDALAAADRIIIPGVGAFPAAMKKIKETGFAAALEEEVMAKGKLVLGICLGMQLLADEGTEFDICPGLGWIGGRIEPITRTNAGLRVPHMGWNELAPTRECELLNGIGDNASCYFVHSFQFKPTDAGNVSATVDYGEPVVAAVSRDNIFGVQFHPEKSQRVGLNILDNFARL